MKKGRWFLVFGFWFLVFSVSLVSAGFFEWMIGKDPNCSPLPGFAPFNVSITILPANTNPFIHNLANPQYVCEGNQTFSNFNVTDNQGDALIVSVSPTIPSAPFFVLPSSISATPPGPTTAGVALRSLTITKNHINQNAGSSTYSETIIAQETAMPSALDSEVVSITAIEINNKPILSPFGVQTFVWTLGEESTFYRQTNVNDIEDGTASTGNFTFELSFLNSAPGLFNITQFGIINYTPNASDFSSLPQTFDIQLCSQDLGIGPTHPLILQQCGQTGAPINSCFNFSLTVTDENRAPVIDSYWPINFSFNAVGTTDLYFNVSAHDPDGNPYMNMNWTVDGIEQQLNLSVNFSEFLYTFECDVGGMHWINVTVSDGIANTTLGWNVSVETVSCPTASGGGGGGGGGGRGCVEQWVCGDWNTCQHASTSLELEIINPEEYAPIFESCTSFEVTEEFCGFHLRDCVDVNACNTTRIKPSALEQCYYTQNPSCSDNIFNCHDGSCETLVDCGGPCDACPTCSDGVRNQAELGVDCGGPCPFACPIEIPLRRIIMLRIIIWAIFIVLSTIIIIKIVGILKARRDIRAAVQAQENNYFANNLGGENYTNA